MKLMMFMMILMILMTMMMIAMAMPLPYKGFLLSESGFVPAAGELAILFRSFLPDDHEEDYQQNICPSTRRACNLTEGELAALL